MSSGSEVSFCILGAIAFGAWQYNIGAGAWMFFILFLAVCLVDSIDQLVKK